MQKNKILMATAELTPLAKTGGLGDVTGALPKALIKAGQDVRLIMPFYGFIKNKTYTASLVKKNISVFIDGKEEKINLFQTFLPNTKIIIYLVKHKYFDGTTIYNGNKVKSAKDYKDQDDIKRFAFFSKSVLEVVKTLNWQPDIIHCHDWHTGLIPYLIKKYYQEQGIFKNLKSLFTIHNLAMQGTTDTKIKVFLGIENKIKKQPFSFMAHGILYADLINTVSPTYAKEILTKEQGEGLEEVLKIRKKHLNGILNGIDTDFFNPATDKYIAQKYSSKNINKKVNNKLVLQKNLGLIQDKNIALVGIVSRLTNQKGIELITDKVEALSCQFVILGTGDKKLEKRLLVLSNKHPEKFNAQIKFDISLAQQIYAGCDLFLMPSRFEPCGLGQLIAMRYGSVPIVRSTGGLADTVKSNVGFNFKQYLPETLLKTLNSALKAYYFNQKQFSTLKYNCLSQDYSWKKPAEQYIKLYNKLANNKQKN